MLTGFNGSTTRSLGETVLLVEVGPISLNVQFSVVADPSPYNAILGRAWIHKMNVTPSTYH